MRLKQVPLSVVAGLAMPVAVMLLNAALGGFRGVLNSLWLRAIYVGAGFLLSLSVALWRPISPLIYCATMVLVFPLIPIVIGGGGNLAGLAVIVLGVMGLAIAVPVAILAPLLRQVNLPAWSPIAVASAAVLLAFTTHAWTSETAQQESVAIIGRLQDIRRAELRYAASRPDHAFTCNGPDLPGLRGIEWRLNRALGKLEKNQGLVDGHWIYLRCPASAHPTSFSIVAMPSWGGRGGGVELDSNGKFASP